MAVLTRVIERLSAECEADGRGRQFAELKLFLTAGKGELSHTNAAQALGLSAGAVRVAVHRLRKRYRQLLREEIAQTLADPAQVDEEMRALFGAFSA
jgi:RNA polymerase sigma-70 factor (ECF subfamily)